MKEQILTVNSRMDKEKKFPTPEIKKVQESTLFLPQGFLASITKEVLAHLDDTETGGYILGLRLKGGLLPLGSFTPPSEGREISRRGFSLSMGGEVCEDFYEWQTGNWPYEFSKFLSEFETRCYPYFTFKPQDRYNPDNPSQKLQVLGIWHKHPGSMAEFSGRDDKQVDRHLDLGLPDYIFPIVTVREKTFPNHFPALNYPETYRIQVNRNLALDVVFYYRSRSERLTKRLKLSPSQVIDSSLFPTLSPTPWFIQDPALLEKEGNRFRDFGYIPTLIIAKKDSFSELSRIIFELTHPAIPDPLYVETSLNFHRDGIFYLVLNSKKASFLKIPKETTIANIIDYYFRHNYPQELRENK